MFPNSVLLPYGVEGDSQTLTLFISKVPRDVLFTNTATNSNAMSNGQNYTGTNNAVVNTPGLPPTAADLRRVSYWLVGGDGDSAQGLARMEVPLTTSDDAFLVLPPNVDNESSYIFAPEVKSLSFSYWDGLEWNDTWDSTQLGTDGITPIGSPLAIAVTISVARGDMPDAPTKEFRHVLVFPPANGSTQQPTPPTTVTAPTTGGGS
jgi:hypothetical protein